MCGFLVAILQSGGIKNTYGGMLDAYGFVRYNIIYIGINEVILYAYDKNHLYDRSGK